MASSQWRCWSACPKRWCSACQRGLSINISRDRASSLELPRETGRGISPWTTTGRCASRPWSVFRRSLFPSRRISTRRFCRTVSCLPEGEMVAGAKSEPSSRKRWRGAKLPCSKSSQEKSSTHFWAVKEGSLVLGWVMVMWVISIAPSRLSRMS